jgi:hypothetical protein
LEGNGIDSNGKTEEINLGYKDGNLVGFTIELVQPDGHKVKTFLVGKMTSDKISGTFVDDDGAKGKWTAVLIPEPPVDE